MVKALVHDPIFLAGQSEKAGKADVFHAYDLLDTLMAHKEGCVGMAANMIGIRKRIIVFVTENGSYMMMLNPVILQKQKPYDTEGSCLSLLGGPRNASDMSSSGYSISLWICRPMHTCCTSGAGWMRQWISERNTGRSSTERRDFL